MGDVDWANINAVDAVLKIAQAQRDKETVENAHFWCSFQGKDACKNLLERLAETKYPTVWGANYVDSNASPRENYRQKIEKLFCKTYPGELFCSSSGEPPQSSDSPPNGPSDADAPKTTSEAFLAGNMALVIGGMLGLAVVCLLMSCAAWYYSKKQSGPTATTQSAPIAPSPVGRGSVSKVEKKKKRKKKKKMKTEKKEESKQETLVKKEKEESKKEKKPEKSKIEEKKEKKEEKKEEEEEEAEKQKVAENPNPDDNLAELPQAAESSGIHSHNLYSGGLV
ncbi:unnamed protein product [Caenorhabditis sp. 36 PRJEB53466]|nr:unnamed protein product [Caenorhabditis sp. 36 PRJEB53466]